MSARRRYRWDKDREELVEVAVDHASAERLQIVPDIQPYNTVTGEHITSRREHREFLKRGGYTEVGSEKPNFDRQRVDTSSHAYKAQLRDDVRRATNDLRYGMAPTNQQILDRIKRQA